MSYRKHYPPDAAHTTARRHLLALLRRTPGRRARWQHLAQRRRPWLLRPLTAGEQTFLRYKGMAEELACLLEPFRRTRLRGHIEVQKLLLDADTRPVVVAQVQQLLACLDRIHPEHCRQGQRLTTWRAQWDCLSPAARQKLLQEEKAAAISYYHDGVQLLLAEAKQDTDCLKGIYPDAFKPAPAPEPWLDSAPKPGPTPYSG